MMNSIEKKYNVKQLSQKDIERTNGGDRPLVRFGRWLGEAWKAFRCACGEGERYKEGFSDFRGPNKW